MDHYSKFEIRFINDKSNEAENFLTYLEDEYDFYNNSDNERKWYYYKKDLMETSVKFPNLTFIVIRMGKIGDFECNLFSNGKILDLIPEEYVSDATKNCENYF